MTKVRADIFISTKIQDMIFLNVKRLHTFKYDSEDLILKWYQSRESLYAADWHYGWIYWTITDVT